MSGRNRSQKLTIPTGKKNTAGLVIKSLKIGGSSGLEGSETVDKEIVTVSNDRSALGVSENRLGGNTRNIDNPKESLEVGELELENENAELKSKIEGSSDSETVKPKENQRDKADIKDINIGDTITTDRMELTINNIELSYDVLPKDTSGFYTHYPADSGKVYIHIDTDVKNMQKQNLVCDDIMEVEAEYNNGFKYTSMTVPEDSSGFTYANITSIIPLGSMGVRFLIECPQEVEETDNPLSLTFKVDNQEFKYIIR